jgi:hypothetical protein
MSIREPLQFHVILRSPGRVGTTKNLTVNLCTEILRGVYFEFAKGMTWNYFRMDPNEESWSRGFARED